MSMYGERIAMMEVEVKGLKVEVREHKLQTDENFKEVNRKLDALLGLRNRGAGVLWLLGSMVAVAGTVYEFFHWRLP